MDDLYREYILELYKNPHNAGDVDAEQDHSSAHNVSCGDTVRMGITLDEQGVVQSVTHQSSGCAISLAAVSILTDQMKGKKLIDLQNMDESQMMDAFDGNISKNREKCLLIGLRAMKELKIKDKK